MPADRAVTHGIDPWNRARLMPNVTGRYFATIR
jgi:hypothetical protein